MATVLVGPMIKRWRNMRRYSQLALSADAGVSQRHLSHIETGKSRPSREMILHLAEVLEVPLRERNALLLAAGYSPEHRQADLDAPEMEDLRRALALVLERHEPYPALVVDRYWQLVAANEPATRLTTALADERMQEVAQGNLMRLLLHPEGMRSVIANFDEVATESLLRLRREAGHYPGDDTIQAVVAEFETYIDLPTPDRSPGFVVPVHFKGADFEIRLFSTIGSLGSPSDVLAQELVIEAFYPLDAADEAALRSLAQHHRGAHNLSPK